MRVRKARVCMSVSRRLCRQRLFVGIYLGWGTGAGYVVPTVAVSFLVSGFGWFVVLFEHCFVVSCDKGSHVFVVFVYIYIYILKLFFL